MDKKVQNYLKKLGDDYTADGEIILTCGGMGAVAMCLLCTVTEGDEVLVQDPVWLNYVSQINFAGGQAVPIPTYEANGFLVTAEEIESKISSKTKVLLINSPCNPTGAVLREEDLKHIAEVAQKHDLLVISDEVYCELTYDGKKHMSIASLPGMKERTVVINSFSKSFAMTGWRLGFAAGPKSIIAKMTVLQENLASCAPAPAQMAGKFALEHMCGVSEMLSAYEKRRNIMVKMLNEIPGISAKTPGGAFYVFANIKDSGLTSQDFAMGLLRSKQVVATPGSAFGECGEGYLRFAYANSEENIIEAMHRVRAYMEEIR